MDKKIAILAGVFVVLLAVTVLVYAGQKPSSNDKTNISETGQTSGDTNSDSPPTSTESAQLGIEDIVEGTGPEAKSGDTVTVNYVGTLEDGTKFDSSYDRNQPYTTQIGAGVVIKGWDQGIPGMKVGGKRKLTVPPELGYGSSAAGQIPPNSTLIFEVELLEVK